MSSRRPSKTPVEGVRHGGVGGTVGDCVLLEEISEDALVDNFRNRFKQDAIYTYIGPVLVSINPYHELPIYTEKHVNDYRDKNLFEMSPHIFAIADETHRSMHERNVDQCVIISGESGSGKTEASKKIMQFIVAVSGSGPVANKVKEQLLQSNPVLEAFGNAKTLRNDNSSRFGKYMDMQFDYIGSPVGGDITNYLLEKSRVVSQTSGERSFHMFYQLLAGAPDGAVRFCKLERDPMQYRYLSDSGCVRVATIDDTLAYKETKNGLDLIGFDQTEVSLLFSLLAAILHIGNIDFTGEEQAVPVDRKSLELAASLVKLPTDMLLEALTNRTVETVRESVKSPLNHSMALFARDALAKAIYDRMFSWVIQRINSKLRKSREAVFGKQSKKTRCIGVLDIYGFEIFTSNTFEQFVINHCNEKLQQIFIELTLKSEQDEYAAEGIEWTPVAYFNNRIICDLIEKPTVGILALLDDMCLRPGNASDEAFLADLDERYASHPHYDSYGSSRNRQIAYTCFRLKHYAGDVDYNTEGFLEKNRDLLFKDLKNACFNSDHALLKACFPDGESSSNSADGRSDKGFHRSGGSKKRPPTAGAQFKVSMQSLMENLLSKTPHYVRCIKPNDEKKAHKFEEDLVRHQCRYLGLLENVRVRRAGFAFRQTYERFVERYRMLTPDVWPYWERVPSREATNYILAELGITAEGFAFGRTKVFVRKPRTVFHLEDSRRQGLHRLATLIQAVYRGWYQWRHYQHMRAAQILISAQWRGYRQRQRYKLMKRSAIKIQAAVRGYFTWRRYIRRFKKWAGPIVSRFMLQWQKVNFLLKYARLLPSDSPLDDSYPPAAPALEKTALLLEDLHHVWRCRNFMRPRIWAAPILTRFMRRFLRYRYLTRLSTQLPSLSPIDKHWMDAPASLQRTSDIIEYIYHQMRCRAYARPRAWATPILQRFMAGLQRYRWLTRVSEGLPTMSPIDKKWPIAPRNLAHVSSELEYIYHQERCRRYARPRAWATPILQRFFRRLQLHLYFKRCAKAWPSLSPIDRAFPTAPKNLSAGHQALVDMFHLYRCREYARPRAKAAPILIRFMAALQRVRFLQKLLRELPTRSPIDRSWPTPPRNLKMGSDVLQYMHHQWRCREYARPRAKAAPVLQRFMKALLRVRWFTRASQEVPTESPTDCSWPPAPRSLATTASIIQRLHHVQRCREYCRPRVWAVPIIQRFLRQVLRHRWLKRLYLELPSDSPIDNAWPDAPNSLMPASNLLQYIHHQWRCREYARPRAWAAPILIRFMFALQKRLYLQRLERELPSESPADLFWPRAPSNLRETDDLLHYMHHQWRCRNYARPRAWAAPILTRFMQAFQKHQYLMRLSVALPTDSPIDKRWMKPPVNCRQTNNLLRSMHHLWRCRNYARPRAAAAPVIIRFMKALQRYRFLMRLAKNLPSNSPIDKRWMKPPSNLRKLSNLIQKIHHQWRCRNYARPRAHAAPIIIRFMQGLQKHQYLMRLSRSLPSDSPIDKRWMKPPSNLMRTSSILRSLHHQWRCRNYARPRAWAAPIIKRFMINLQKFLWLTRLSRSLPRDSPTAKGTWMTPRKNLRKVSEELEKMHHRWRCRKYRLSLSASRKRVLREKLFASETFRGRKSTYDASVPIMFRGDRFGLNDTSYVGMWNEVQATHGVKRLVHTQRVNKHHRSGGSMHLLVIVTDNNFLFVKETKKALQVKYTLPFDEVLGLSTSTIHDGTVILHVRAADVGVKAAKGVEKGDYLLELQHPIEFITKAAMTMRSSLKRPIQINIADDIAYVAKGVRQQMHIVRSSNPTLTTATYVHEKKGEHMGYVVSVPQNVTPVMFNMGAAPSVDILDM